MSAIPDGALSALHAVYRQLDVEIEPLRRFCDSRGLCCHFASSGHMLFVTGLEAAGMAGSAEAPDAAQAAAGSCPFLRGKLCGIRGQRALGCRIYFCDKTHEEERNALYERFLKEVRDIEARFGLEHSYQPVTAVEWGREALSGEQIQA